MSIRGPGGVFPPLPALSSCLPHNHFQRLKGYRGIYVGDPCQFMSNLIAPSLLNCTLAFANVTMESMEQLAPSRVQKLDYPYGCLST